MTDTMPADSDSQLDPQPDAAPPESPPGSTFLAAGFEKGQKVLLFNQETGRVDLPAEVNHVLDAPLKYGALDIPPGSVGVSTTDSAQVWWIRPELIATMLRAAEDTPQPEVSRLASLPHDEAAPEDVPSSGHASPGAAFAPPPRSATPAAAAEAAPEQGAAARGRAPTAEEKVAQAMEEESHLEKALGWISRSLGMTPWSKKEAAPAPKAAPALAAHPTLQKSGLVQPCRGDRDRADSAMDHMDSEIPAEREPPKPQDSPVTSASGISPAVSSRMEAQPDGSSATEEESLKRGSLVDVWSNSLEAWEQNGVVVDVAETPQTVNGVELPVGSVMVSFRGGMANKWVRPEQIDNELRRAQDRPSALTGSSSVMSQGSDQAASFAQDLKVGDRVMALNNGTKSWEEAEVIDILKDAMDTGSFQLPKGCITVSFRNGAERHVIMPDLFSAMLRPSAGGAVAAAAVGGDGSTSVPPGDDAGSQSVVGDRTVPQCGGDRPSPLDTQFVVPTQTVLLQGAGSTMSVASGPLPETGEDAGVAAPAAPAAPAPDPAPALAAAPAPDPAPAPAAAPAPDPAPVPAVAPAPDPAPAPAPAPAPVLAPAVAPSAPLAPAQAPAPAPTPAFAAVPTLPAGAPAAASDAGPRAAPGGGLDRPFDRTAHRVLVIGPGFGRELNPAQGQLLEQSGYQICWVVNLPNPETPMFPVAQFLPTLKQAIDDFKPHCIASASKGGAYMTALWQTGLWTGPSLIINRHPTLVSMPKNVSVVLCHGSNDEYYQFRREDLEALSRTGSENRCLLYYTGNSGLLGRGYTREGDRHNMQSLLQYDCLPRLIDAVLCDEGPEVQLMRSWRGMVTEERLRAEEWLGFSSSGLRRFWASEDQKGMDEQVLFEVKPDTEEYAQVATIFRANPRVPRAYHDMNPGMWQEISILKMERVENGMQEDGSAEPYFNALQRGIENQGVHFRPGLHTRWAFHGSDAIESIVSNPISGFQPLMSGSRAQSLWGPGTYFARDAKYVYDGGFCRTAEDGSRQILLCLLMTGMSCLGDPLHKGVLPMRQGRHRYNSSVDSLSNPEIFVTQSPGAAYPAYVITFA